MFKVFQRLNERLVSLLDGRENIAQIVVAQDVESAVVLRAVQSLDESREADLFWINADPFTDAPSYARAVESNLRAFVEALRATQTAKNLPVWPAVPGPTGAPPVARIRELMIYTRGLFPFPGAALSVWGFIPSAIANTSEWGAFVASLTEHQWPLPWCHGLRMYFRVADEASLGPAAKRPHIDLHRVDLSSPAIEKGLHEDAASTDLPLAHRVQSTLLLAGIDQSHKRFPDAIQKFRLVLKYALNTRQPALAGTAAIGIGDVFKATGKPGLAESWYLHAINAGAAGPTPAVPVVHNALRGCTELAHARSDWAAVEAYSGSTAPLAGMLCMPDQRIECMEKQADAQLRQGKTAEAVKSWTAAADAARAGELPDAERRILGRLIEQANTSGDAAAAAKWRERLGAVGRPVAAASGAPSRKGGA